MLTHLQRLLTVHMNFRRCDRAALVFLTQRFPRHPQYQPVATSPLLHSFIRLALQATTGSSAFYRANLSARRSDGIGTVTALRTHNLNQVRQRIGVASTLCRSHQGLVRLGQYVHIKDRDYQSPFHI